MKRFLPAAVLAALLASSTLAQVNVPPATATVTVRGDAAGFVALQETDELLAADLIGRPIYNRADEVLGAVNNLAFTQDGHITVVIMSVGGFLGIGARNVAIAFDAIELTVNADGDIRWIFNATPEQVAAAPDFSTLADRDLDPVIAPPPPPAPMTPAPVTPTPAPMTPPAAEPPAPFAPAPAPVQPAPTPTPAPTPAPAQPVPTPAPTPGQPAPVTPPTPPPATPGGA